MSEKEALPRNPATVAILRPWSAAPRFADRSRRRENPQGSGRGARRNSRENNKTLAIIHRGELSTPINRGGAAGGVGGIPRSTRADRSLQPAASPRATLDQGAIRSGLRHPGTRRPRRSPTNLGRDALLQAVPPPNPLEGLFTLPRGQHTPNPPPPLFASSSPTQDQTPPRVENHGPTRLGYQRTPGEPAARGRSIPRAIDSRCRGPVVLLRDGPFPAATDCARGPAVEGPTRHPLGNPAAA